jgi:hypothetical protein
MYDFWNHIILKFYLVKYALQKEKVCVFLKIWVMSVFKVSKFFSHRTTVQKSIQNLKKIFLTGHLVKI